jgi:O-antigen/teichoic acid export membrane protein
MWIGANLSVLLPATIFARILTLVALLVFCRRNITVGNQIRFVRNQAFDLLKFGGWVTVTAFIGPMMTILDRFIIGSTLGAKAVTIYTIPFQLAERTLIIPGALSSALFPKFSSSSYDRQHEISANALRSILVVITPIILVGILLLEPFLSLWINPELAEQSYVVGCILLLGFWINSFAQIPYVLLQSRKRPDIVAKCHMAELPFYLALLYFGLHFFGLLGAAVAFSIRTMFDFILLAAFAKILKQSLQLFIWPAILLLGAFLIALNSDVQLIERILFMAFNVVMTIIWAWKKAPDSIKNLVSLTISNFTSQIMKMKGNG